mgnify:CR=1 FL=1
MLGEGSGNRELDGVGRGVLLAEVVLDREEERDALVETLSDIDPLLDLLAEKLADTESLTELLAETLSDSDSLMDLLAEKLADTDSLMELLAETLSDSDSLMDLLAENVADSDSLMELLAEELSSTVLLLETPLLLGVRDRELVGEKLGAMRALLLELFVGDTLLLIEMLEDCEATAKKDREEVALELVLPDLLEVLDEDMLEVGVRLSVMLAVLESVEVLVRVWLSEVDAVIEDVDVEVGL